MKNLLTLLFFTAFTFLISGCVKDNVTKTYTFLQPVLKDKEQVISEVGSGEARSMINPGKIYVYGNYLFVNEVNKGVHIIDNSNPSKPVNTRFINIPGNVDIAVKGHSLYADIYTDMLTLDISNPLDVKVTAIEKGVFPERQYTGGFLPDSTKYITEWIQKDTTINYDNENPWGGCRGCGIWLNSASFSNMSAEAMQVAVGKITTGISGSMARFTIVSNYLYAVNLSSLQVFNISQLHQPEKVNTVNVGWNIETIYPFMSNLFIGSSTGMYIFDIKNPAEPSRVATVQHIRMCDPVISDGEYAYVTLRAGSECGTIIGSRLQIYNLDNLYFPQLIKTYDLENPYGLGKTGNLLWICDGTAGMKVFNAADPLNIQLKYHIKNIEPYDVIPVQNKIIVSAKEGIIQYDVSDTENITELSRIKKAN